MTNLRPSFEHAYPDGTEGGECGTFAQWLVNHAPVGDTNATKLAAVVNHGIQAKDLHQAFRLGDVVIFNIPNLGAGHVAVINEIFDDHFTVSESNWHLDGKVHHDRAVPKGANSIVGVLRGPLVVALWYYPLFMKIKIINNHRSDALNAVEVQDIVNTAAQYSQGALQLVIDGVDTNFTNIPYATVGEAGVDTENPTGLTVKAIDFGWFKDNIAYLGQGHDAALFWVADEDWQGNVNGVEHMDSGLLPCFVECHTQDQTEQLNLAQTQHYGLTWLTLHEIRHAMCAIAGVVDDTHDWLTKGQLPQSFLPANFDYDLLEQRLAALRASQVIPAGSPYPIPTNFDSGQYQNFTPDVRAALVANSQGAHNMVVNGMLAKPWQ